MSEILKKLLKLQQPAEVPRRDLSAQEIERRHLEDVAYFERIERPINKWRREEWERVARVLARAVETTSSQIVNAKAEKMLEQIRKKRQRRNGAIATMQRAETFRNELFSFMVDLMRREPNLLNKPRPHILIADKVRTAEASKWKVENKTWNRRGARSNSPFFSERMVRAEVQAALPDAKKSAGIR
jgi:hypothetical protein